MGVSSTEINPREQQKALPVWVGLGKKDLAEQEPIPQRLEQLLERLDPWSH